MENRNIYKMDDVLIAASFLMLIPAVYFAWPWLVTLPGSEDLSAFFPAAPAILGRRLNMVLLYLGGSLLAQVFGRIIRKEEKQALDVLDTILYMRNTTFDQLAVNLDMSRARVEKITGKLSGIRTLNIRIEGDSVNMESPRPEYIPSPGKPSAHTGSSAEISEKTLSFQEKLALLSQQAAVQKEGDGNEAVEKTAESAASMGPEEQKKMKRNAVIMVILFMTPLWPVALIMIISMIVKQTRRAKQTSL